MFQQCQSCALDLLRQQHMPAESRNNPQGTQFPLPVGQRVGLTQPVLPQGLNVLAEEPAQVEASAQVLPMPLNKGFSQ